MNITLRTILLSLLISLLFLNNKSYSQNNYTIKVFNTDNIPLSKGVLFVNKNDTLNSRYILFNKYEIELQNIKKNDTIEIRVNEYEQFNEIVKNLTFNNNTLDIYLEKKEGSILDEIVINVDNKIRIKNDTVVYDVKSFLNGTELKVEDVLKKLPGVEVDKKTGNIKYKGKQIETILLDGDNLFDSNYILGSKNINVNLVDKIEAIDNYEKNKILKSISKETNKSVLNLKLKEDVNKISFDNYLSGGYIDPKRLAFDINNSTLFISKKSKGFITINSDNIDKEDYFSKIFRNTYLDKKLQYNIEKPPLSKRNLSNSTNTFLNLNLLNKLHKKLSIRNDFFVYDSTIKGEEFFNNTYKLNDSLVNIWEQNTGELKKTSFKYQNELNYDYSENSIFTLKNSFTAEKENISKTYNVNTNDNSFLKNNSNDYFFNTELSHNLKIASQTILLSNIKLYSFKTKSLLNINPEGITQILEEKRNSLIPSISLIRKSSDDKIVNSLNLMGNFYNYNIYSINTLGENDNKLIASKASINYNLKLTFDELSFDLSNNLIFDDYSVNKDETEIKETYYLPNFKIKYRLNNISVLGLNYDKEKLINILDHLNYSPLFIDTRGIVSSDNTTDYSKKTNYSVNYNLNDMYNQFFININTEYSNILGDYNTNNRLKDNYSITNFFFINKKQNEFSININTSKYFDFISSSIKLDLSHRRNRSFFYIEDKENMNSNNSYFLYLFLKSQITKKLYFNIDSELNHTRIKNPINSNNFSNLNVTSSITFSPSEELNFAINYECFIPNTKISRSYNFLNFNTYFKVKNNMITLKVNNILNVKSYSNYTIDEWSSNYYEIKILPFFLTVGTIIRF